MSRCRCLNCITPPHILKKLLESKNKAVREAALSTIVTTARLKGERTVRAQLGSLSTPGTGRRTVYDMHRTATFTSATVARTEDGADSPDLSANRAFEGLGLTRDFYKAILKRNSIDDRGMRIDGYIHYAEDARGYNNAYWDGQKMVFGDGDGIIFSDFTGSIDVIGHELTHGVTEFSAGLEYHKQPGALNESISDVFGSLIKQWDLRQTAADADWLIGKDIFTPGEEGDALRSLKAPGTAYDNPDMGKDPQPDHMKRYIDLPDTYEGDWGGVHINSGIPNKAFYCAAINIGGFAWEKAGKIWYAALRASSPLTSFQEFADTTVAKAEQDFNGDSSVLKAVQEAWREVGITVRGAPGVRSRRDVPLAKRSGREQDLEAILDDLSSRVAHLAQELERLKGVA